MAYGLELDNQRIDNRYVMCLANHFYFVDEQWLKKKQTQEESKQIKVFSLFDSTSPLDLSLTQCAIYQNFKIKF